MIHSKVFKTFLTNILVQRLWGKKKITVHRIFLTDTSKLCQAEPVLVLTQVSFEPCMFSLILSSCQSWDFVRTSENHTILC